MGFFFLISIYDISLLVYKNAFDFWILTLYPTICQIHLFGLVVFLVESIGFSVYTIMSSANSDSFTSSFQIWLPFISFYFLTTVARTSNTMLNRNDESGQPCHAPDLRGKDFSFCLWSMMLAVGLSYKALIMLRNAPFLPTFTECFYHKWDLSNAFSASIIWSFVFCVSYCLCDILYFLICIYYTKGCHF